MIALKQIIDDPGEFMPVPPEVRHRRTEVIFLVLDTPSDEAHASKHEQLAALAGSWEGELIREPQGEFEERLDLG